MDVKLDRLKSLMESIDNSELSSLETNLSSIYKDVINEYSNKQNLNLLTNNYSIEFIKPIIYNHIYTIKEALVLKNHNTLLNHLSWELHTYKKIGISDDFFKYLFEYIIKSIENIIKIRKSNLSKFYSFLIENHDYILSISDSLNECEFEPNENKELYEDFLDALLNSNMSKAIALSNSFIKNRTDVEYFWANIILPAMYSIGSKWSEGEISVGQEHSATSICQRIMTLHYEKILDDIQDNSKVLVVTAPEELHQVGARMVSDFLELNGYDVYYFSSNTEFKTIIETIKNENIKDLIVSATLVSNLGSTKKFISEIRSELGLDEITVFAGGQAFNSISEADSVNADYCIKDINSLLRILKEKNNA